MIKARLVRSDGEELVLKLPESDKPEEISMEMFINFNVGFNRLNHNIATAAKEGLLFDKNLGYTVNLLNLMRDCFPEVENKFFKLDVSQEANKDMIANVAELKKYTQGKAEVDLESMLQSFEQIVGYLYKIIFDWEPTMPLGDAFKFTHRGRTFVLPEVRRDTVFKKYRFGKVTFEKLVEIQQFHRMIKKKTEQNQAKHKNDEEMADKKDPDGSLAFTKMLTTLAMLVDEEGEKPPDSPKEFDRRVEERKVLFQDIPMTIGRTATFFLLGMKNI